MNVSASSIDENQVLFAKYVHAAALAVSRFFLLLVAPSTYNDRCGYGTTFQLSTRRLQLFAFEIVLRQSLTSFIALLGMRFTTATTIIIELNKSQPSIIVELWLDNHAWK